MASTIVPFPHVVCWYIEKIMSIAASTQWCGSLVFSIIKVYENLASMMSCWLKTEVKLRSTFCSVVAAGDRQSDSNWKR